MSRIGIKIDIGEGKIGVVYAAPHEALKALEEQALEVLEKWKKLHPITVCWWCGNEIKSPWIKVSDREPPKDGETFIIMDSWGECSSVAWNHGQKAWEGFESRYFNKFDEGTKWMPMPE